MKFVDINTKNKIKDLTFGKKLTLNDGNEVIEITASHDRTPKQRETFKKLQSELLKQKQETGDNNLVIRNGKIMKDFVHEPRRTKASWAAVARNLS